MILLFDEFMKSLLNHSRPNHIARDCPEETRCANWKVHQLKTKKKYILLSFQWRYWPFGCRLPSKPQMFPLWRSWSPAEKLQFEEKPLNLLLSLFIQILYEFPSCAIKHRVSPTKSILIILLSVA